MPLSLPTLLRRAALLAALALALPAASASAFPTPGVNLDGIPTDAQLDQAAAVGAKTARMFLLWSDLEPAAPSGGTHHYAAGTLARYDQIVARLALSGIKPVFVITGSPSWASGSGNVNTPPRNAADYAAFAHDFAARYAGKVAAYEIWNEEDGADFWSTGPDAGRYAALLRAAYPALKSGDPSARVLMGPLVGNDYDFLAQVYAAGGKGTFDGVSVHTDTACLDRGPDQFYREPSTGRIGRFTFLAYREVRQTMLANGDDKPLWMTELGWSSTGTTCGRGQWAGQKPAGVSEANQAAYLKQAYHCLAADPYVEGALWFTARDLAPGDSELTRYGLYRHDGSRKPSWDAFRTVATQGDTLTGACGDFAGPKITVLKPTANVQYAEKLVISASATDARGQLARITLKADGKKIRNYTGDDLHDGRPVTMEWQGSKELSLGAHTITIEAVDKGGNTSHVDVPVRRVSLSKLAATLPTAVRAKLSSKGLLATLAGRVRTTGDVGMGGSVKIVWQKKSGKRWKTVHGAAKTAARPFRFRQKLAGKGTWRVRVQYVNRAPYKRSTSPWKVFRAR